MNQQYFGLIQAQGDDAQQFLQGQLSCDLQEVSTEQFRLGAHCNPQGRMLSSFYLFSWNQCYYFLLPRSMVDLTLQGFKTYLLFSRCEMTDVTNQFHIALLESSGQPPETATSNEQQCQLQISPSEAIQISTDSTETGLTANQWQFQEIARGHTWVLPETSGKHLPQAFNYDFLNGVSFTKGCYTGQEVIARMHYKGKMKQRLYCFQSSQQPVVGQSITSDTEQKVGEVVSYIGTSKGHELLAVVRHDRAAEPLFIGDKQPLTALNLDTYHHY